MKRVCWPYFDPDFDNLPERIYGPACRVCIDNECMEDCTVVKVDRVNRQGLLLQVVQVLTDLNLTISKSYISSDAGWFMDVFHVKDEHGKKLADDNVINYIQQAIGTTRETPSPAKFKTYANVFETDCNEHTAVEMTGPDRPGLFSEISAALADLHCNIVEAHAWSHNARLACVAYISDQSSDTPIEDPNRLASIEDHLWTVLRATGGAHLEKQEVKTGEFVGGEGHIASVERRLHQLMLSVRDFDGPSNSGSSSLTSESEGTGDEDSRRTLVSIENCDEKSYSIVSLECKDRPRLMFDTVCTLTDMQYAIFHASIASHGAYAFQEYFIRHVDGYALNTESEKQRVIKCLEAAIERRVCEGLKLKLCAENRVGLLSDITRVLRENGLTVIRADIATKGERAENAFYIRDISGNEVDMDLIESMKEEMGAIDLEVKNDSNNKTRPNSHDQRSRFSFGDLLKSQIERLSHNFIPIK